MSAVDGRRIRMPSPFPGMDPYLEGTRWHGFHTVLCVEIGRQLAPKIEPKYAALVEEWLTEESVQEVTITSRPIRPDVSVLRESNSRYGAATIEPPVQMD